MLSIHPLLDPLCKGGLLSGKIKPVKRVLATHIYLLLCWSPGLIANGHIGLGRVNVHHHEAVTDIEHI